MVPVFERADGYVSVYYWYDKYCIPVEWSGKLVKNRFNLTEADPENDAGDSVKALINATWANRRITGT